MILKGRKNAQPRYKIFFIPPFHPANLINPRDIKKLRMILKGRKSGQPRYKIFFIPLFHPANFQVRGFFKLTLADFFFELPKSQTITMRRIDSEFLDMKLLYDSSLFGYFIAWKLFNIYHCMCYSYSFSTKYKSKKSQNIKSIIITDIHTNKNIKS